MPHHLFVEWVEGIPEDVVIHSVPIPGRLFSRLFDVAEHPERFIIPFPCPDFRLVSSPQEFGDNDSEERDSRRDKWRRCNHVKDSHYS